MRHYKYTSRVAAVAFAVAVVAVLAMPGVVVGNELDDMLYDDMAQEPCVRLINAFGSVGCSSTSCMLLPLLRCTVRCWATGLAGCGGVPDGRRVNLATLG